MSICPIIKEATQKHGFFFVAFLIHYYKISAWHTVHVLYIFVKQTSLDIFIKSS